MSGLLKALQWAPEHLPLRRQDGRDHGQPCVWGRSVGGRSPGGSCSLARAQGVGSVLLAPPHLLFVLQLLVFWHCPCLCHEPALARATVNRPIISGASGAATCAHLLATWAAVGICLHLLPSPEAPLSPTPFSGHSSGLAGSLFFPSSLRDVSLLDFVFYLLRSLYIFSWGSSLGFSALYCWRHQGYWGCAVCQVWHLCPAGPVWVSRTRAAVLQERLSSVSHFPTYDSRADPQAPQAGTHHGTSDIVTWTSLLELQF